jgi:hypothetical protein
MIPQCLRGRPFTIALNSPENFSHSNGITVLLDAALALHQAGLDVDILPTHSTTPLYSSLADPYSSLRISWELRPGGHVIVCDTIAPDRLEEVRAKAWRICHYILAPAGLFGRVGPFANHSIILPGEAVAVHSPQVSTEIPSFYLQTRFPDLEPFIADSLRRDPTPRTKKPAKRLAASVYAGKGYLRPIPDRLRRRIDRSRSFLITRNHPATKKELYQTLSRSDVLICFDPLTSVAHEASLLGVPVYIPVAWDEPCFRSLHPVRMDGIVWDDLEQMMDLIDEGYDQHAIVTSYHAAVANFMDALIGLLHYSFSSTDQHVRPEWINQYWQQRQPFFDSLKLPSPVSAWAPIGKALPSSTALEIAADRVSGLNSKRQRLISRLTSLVRRFYSFMPASWRQQLTPRIRAARRLSRKQY